MKRQALIGAGLVALLILASLPALAQSPAGMKLYVFTSGSLGGFPKGALQIGGQGNIDWAPVSFYVITHPKGNVMFDTGNNDKTITDPDGWWGPLAKGFGLKMTQNDAMAAQLAKIGLIELDDVLDGTVVRVPKAYPAYFGSYGEIGRVREYLDQLANVFPVGRNGMHRYNNQDHSMLTSMTAVENIVAGRTDKANLWAINTETEYHEEKTTSK